MKWLIRNIQIRSRTLARRAEMVTVPLRISPVRSRRIRVTEHGRSQAVLQNEGTETEHRPFVIWLMALTISRMVQRIKNNVMNPLCQEKKLNPKSFSQIQNAAARITSR